jgi:zona occludens toxin
MAKIVTGIQGSGKSYFAMYDIYTNQEKYFKVYSNLDKLRNTKTVHSLDFNSFVTYGLKECYKIMVTSNQGVEADYEKSPREIFNLITNQSATFSDAIEHLKKIKLLPDLVSEDNRVLMIIDEAQDYFGKTVKISPELLWFITQHRHLYIEVVLLTQNVSLLRPDYKLFNEVYDAVPPTKQFDKNYFSYHQYAGLPIHEDNYVGKIKLKRLKEVFALYESGDKVDSPNILKRFIYMGVGAVVFALLMLYLLKDMLTPEKVETASKNSTIKLISDNKGTYISNYNSDYSSLVYIKLNCIHDTCTNKLYKVELDIDDLKATVTNTQSKFLGTKKLSANLATVTLLATTDFLNLFQGANNEKNNKGFGLIN